MRPLGLRVYPALQARRGFTLAELLVALSLLGVVGGALRRALDRQARFHTGILQVLQARQQLIASHEVIAAELRTLASPADVEHLSDTSLVYRTPIGSGIACRISGPDLDLAPDQLASGAILGRARAIPQPGDTVWLHDEGPGDGGADDRWHATVLAAASRRRDACLGTSFVDSTSDRGLTGWRLTLSSGLPLPASVTAGTTVRLSRRARFALYRSSTGDSNLGWSDWNAALASWNVIQPVAGPFLPFDRTAPPLSGVAFAGRDSSGVALALPAPAPAPRSISVMTRSLTNRVVRLQGVHGGRRADSLRSFTALRNAP